MFAEISRTQKVQYEYNHHEVQGFLLRMYSTVSPSLLFSTVRHDLLARRSAAASRVESDARRPAARLPEAARALREALPGRTHLSSARHPHSLLH